MRSREEREVKEVKGGDEIEDRNFSSGSICVLAEDKEAGLKAGTRLRSSEARAAIGTRRGLPVGVRGKSGSGHTSQVRICWWSARVALAALMAELSEVEEVEEVEEVKDEDWRSATCAHEVGVGERFLASLGMTMFCPVGS